MKVLVQWARRNPAGWDEVDSADWPETPSKPEPTGLEVLDSLPGWITAINVQGVLFTGYDHYAVQPLGAGARVTCWNDDPEDQDLAAVRRIRPDQPPFPLGFYGQVCDFLPIAPDPDMGGAYNTRQTFTFYADGQAATHMRDGGLEVHPFSQLPIPSDNVVRHGIWMSPELMDNHLRVQGLRGWREWTEGVPTSEIVGGRIRPQRSASRWLKAKGTRTFYQRNTDLATGVHAATNEDELNDAAGAGETEGSGSHAFGVATLAYCFTTQSGAPNDADWPNGTYRCQFDVSAAGANMSYGLLTIGTAAGHFARVNSGLTADQESWTQSQAAFTGTGLKLASQTRDPAAGAVGDRFECLVAARNNATMNAAQSITLTFDADAFVDGPWVVLTAYEMDANPGSYSITGAAAEFDLALEAVPGSYALAGAAAEFDLALEASPGAYLLTGTEVGFDLALEAVPGSYALAGAAAEFEIALDASPGVYLLTGFEAGTVWSGDATYEMDASPGAYSIVGALAEFALEIEALPGVYVLSGADAGLEWTPVVTSAGTDRRVHPTRRPEVVTVMVVGRKQPVLALIEKQKLARDARLEQQRMAMEESARRDALVGEADAILAEIHAKQEREAVTAEKRMRNLAMAQAVQRRKKAEKEAHEKEIRRKRLKSLRKARRARRK